jgi:preprotein translocase subunit SecD
LVGLLVAASIIATTPPLSASPPVHRATYVAVGPATSGQLKTTVHILQTRLNRAGVSSVQVSLVSGGVTFASKSSALSANLLAAITQPSELSFRPVLCFAYPLITSVPGSNGKKHLVPDTSGSAQLPSCGVQFQANSANMDVKPNNSKEGFSNSLLQPDPEFATITDTPPTAIDYPAREVLLPGLANGKPSDQGMRYVLGPEEMSGSSIGAATVRHSQSGILEIEYQMRGAAASRLWDKVAEENFHQPLAIELDGVVYSDPIIQPAQSTFASFHGEGEISGGNLYPANAQQLVEAIRSGSLPVRLELRSK